MEDIKTFSNSNFNKSAYLTIKNSYPPNTVHAIRYTNENRNKISEKKEMVIQPIFDLPKAIRS
jgi:hypothetical protein